MARSAGPLDQRDWTFEAREDSAVLLYRDGPERILSLECRGGQDPELSLMVWEPKRPADTVKPGEIVLASGGARQTYPTLTEANRNYWEMMGHIRKTDPVILALRETGWMTVVVDGRSETLIPQHNNSSVPDFFEWCH